LINLAGIHLTILLGPTLPEPAPYAISQAFESLEVTANDDGPTVFQLALRVDRTLPWGVFDYPLLQNPLVQPFNRIIFIITFNFTPTVLFDGFITNMELQPDAELLYLTGEDISLKLDMAEKSGQFVDMPDSAIVEAILAEYIEYIQEPFVAPTPQGAPNFSTNGLRTQQGTDLNMIRRLAARYGYVFYVEPAELPGMNRAYFGPPAQISEPQPALSINMGAASNVRGAVFSYDALRPFTVDGLIQDVNTEMPEPVAAFLSERTPLALRPALEANLPNVRTRKFRSSGLTLTQALSQAEAMVSRSTDSVVRVTGSLDAVQYNGILRARRLVGVRGAGFSFDGFYYVESVSHSLRQGSYTQNFALTREGLDSTTPVTPV
jgi:hypothetical protein